VTECNSKSFTYPHDLVEANLVENGNLRSRNLSMPAVKDPVREFTS